MTPISIEWVGRLKVNLLVPYYLMASYLYYHCDLSLMSDEGYDLCCSRLYKLWSVIKHRDKSIISRSALTATTGYHIKRRDIPTIAQIAAHRLYDLAKKDEIYENISPALVPPKPISTNVPTPHVDGGAGKRTPVLRSRSSAASQPDTAQGIQRGSPYLTHLYESWKTTN